MESSEAIKNILRQMTPPGLIKAYRKLYPKRLKAVDFEGWWETFSTRRDISPDLKKMVDGYVQSKSFAQSSQYWNYLSQKNIEQLAEGGYDTFKQTIARNYFTFVGGLDPAYIGKLLPNLSKLAVKVPGDQILKKHDLFTTEESIFYNTMTVLLLDHFKKTCPEVDLKKLEEPLSGNPPFITVDGVRVTQDILNSCLEYASIARGCDLSKVSTILEVGAGSGRTAFSLLKRNANIKYIIADIPPALFISQTYLTEAFKDKKIFKYRPFKAFSEIEKEFREADIVFLMSDQIELLPADSIDLFLAIDCLHEMKKEQIQNFFDHSQRLARYFYFKCWQATDVPLDNISHKESDYPVKSNWKESFRQPCTVPATFFEAFYQIK